VTGARARPPARRRREPRLARRLTLAALVLAGGVVVFALGVGFGRALDENPDPGGTITQVRTLRPLPLAPARETVTQTVTAQ
jgi:hypothetical protein